jgi:hypothetical protein
MGWHHHHGREGSAEPLGGHGVALPSELSSDFVLLAPEGVKFRGEGGGLRMEREGEEGAGERVAVFRLFPLSEPEQWISVVDAEGRELGIVRHLRRLDRASQEAVREELRRRYVVAQVRRIVSCTERFDMVELVVDTDRGRRRFVARNLREHIKQPTPERILLTDIDGNRYDIPDYGALDAKSRALIERYI